MMKDEQQDERIANEHLRAVVDDYINALAAIALIREIAEEYLGDRDCQDAERQADNHTGDAGRDQDAPLITGQDPQ